MSDKFTSYVGDTTDVWEVGLNVKEPGEDSVPQSMDGFSCALQVANSSIDRAVTLKSDDGLRFRAWLTPTETALLGVGTWTVGIQISNPTFTPPMVREKQLTLVLKAQVVT